MSLSVRRPFQRRLTVHPVMLLAVALLLGIAAGAWQWTSRGVTATVTTQAATPDLWKQTTARPEVVTGPNQTYKYTCSGGSVPGTRLEPGWLTDFPFPPNPQQLPEYVACFQLREGADEVTDTLFLGPTLEDVQLAAIVGIAGYFLAVAFILSFRALSRPEQAD